MLKDIDTLRLIRLSASEISWILSPKYLNDKLSVARLRNTNTSQKAVILCNGPTLTKVDFDLLQKADVATFGLNKINLLFSSTNFRPDYVVSVNPYVIEQNREFFNSTAIPLFLDKNGAKAAGIRSRKGVVRLRSRRGVGRFSRICELGVFQGYTVTYVAMQLAFHMGFENVALVGCDHNFPNTGRPNNLAQAQGPDENHFHPDYFSGGDNWQYPDLIGSEFHYQLARTVYESQGRKIVNCTDGGRLEVFQRQDLSEFIELL